MSVKSETRIPIRIFNIAAPLFESDNSKYFDADQMLETAAKRYGSDDFGDEQFLEGLDVLFKSINKEASLHPFGRMFSRFVLLNLLRNRLELTQRWKEYPEVLDRPVERPVFIVGSPRTGTTLLFNLLTLDDHFRFYRAWEAGRPGLPYSDKELVQKAKKESQKTMGTFNYLRPGLKKIHHLAVEKPEECNFLLANSFEASFFSFIFRVESYHDWFSDQDHSYSYAYYKKQLQWLQSKTPSKRWLLKSPAHMPAFKNLFDEFPDALVIQTHRDPQDILPSLCSLKYNFMSMVSYDIRKKEIGEIVENHLSDNLQTVFELRETHNYQVLDILYSDLVKNPMAVLEQVYAYIGESFSADTQKRAMDYLSLNPKDKFGRHEYNADEMGLDQKTIQDDFDFYYRRFNYFNG